MLILKAKQVLHLKMWFFFQGINASSFWEKPQVIAVYLRGIPFLTVLCLGADERQCVASGETRHQDPLYGCFHTQHTYRKAQLTLAVIP